MYYYHTNDEIDEIGEGIIRKYNYQAFIQGDPTDIEGFIADHLNYRIVYDRLADKDAGRMAFLADGKDTRNTVNCNIGNPKTKPNCSKPFRMSRKNCLKSSAPQKSS